MPTSTDASILPADYCTESYFLDLYIAETIRARLVCYPDRSTGMLQRQSFSKWEQHTCFKLNLHRLQN